jgi:hypothetical protein
MAVAGVEGKRRRLPEYASMKAVILLLAVLVASVSADAGDSNAWIQVSEDAVGPRHSPGLVWSEELHRFVLFGGAVSHRFQGRRPYDYRKQQWNADPKKRLDVEIDRLTGALR